MKNKLSIAVSLAVVLAMIAATFAIADGLILDADGLTPVVDAPSLALGNVCTGTTVTKTVLHAVIASGRGQGNQGKNWYADNAVVTVLITSVSGAGLSANIPSGSNTIDLPSNWTSQSNNTVSVNSVSSSIVFDAGSTPRDFSGTVDYSASGQRASDGQIRTDTDLLTVTANVVNCDTTPPTLMLPDDMAVEATSATGAAVTFTATASDANPLNPTVTCDANSGDIFPLDVTTTVNCSATDAASNTAYGSFDITVVDTAPPTVTPPSNIVAEAADGSGAVVSYSGESALDIVDGSLAATCLPASGSTFSLGLNTVTCSATDAHNNTGGSDFTIDVQDNTAPILALPAEITEEATGASGAAVTFSVSASDLVDGDVAVSCDWNDGDTFPLGATVVSCSATDTNGNTSTGSFSVTVVDTTAPSLTLPPDFSVEATGPDGAVATFSASASDIVDGPVSVSCTPSSGSTFALGATQVDCSAMDAAGNTSNGSFNFTVQDTTPPALTLPADQQLEATGPTGALATFTASATDLVDGPLTVSCDANSGDTFPLGTTIVSCSVSDAAGNTATGSFVIIVEDTTVPTITFVSRTPANGNGWNNGNVTVTWSCSDIVEVVSASVSETVSTEGENQFATGTCEDTSDNTASDTQTGINIDKTKPSASASRTPDANTFGWNNVDVTVSFNGADDLSGIDVCSADQVFDEGANQSASGTCTDKAGNVSDSATVSDINVDKTAPTISGAPDRSANVNDWYNADVTVSFTCHDALSGVDSCTAPDTLGEGAGQSVPGSVTDKAGNSANTTVSGINIDKTDPVISASLDKTPDVSGWFNILTGVPTVSFVCSDALSGLDGDCPADHTFGDGENQSYNQTVFDLAGNSASDGVSNVDVDTVAPSVSVALDRAAASSGWFNSSTGAPVAEFTCSDGTSGIATCPADFTFGEGEDLSHSGTAFDNAGNSASASVSNVDVDLTAPAVTVTPARGTDYNGWYNAPVSFAFSGTDATSGVDSCDPDENYNGPDSAAASVSGSCTDNAGNTGSAMQEFQYDNTDPAISAIIAPPVSSYGWWNISTGAPTVSFSCSDVTADVESCQSPHTFGNGEDQDFSGSVKDNAGNTSSASVSNIDVDLIAPTVSAALDRSADATTGWFNASIGAPTVEFSCADSGSSGLADCPDDYLFGEGANQYRNGLAYDNAGNSASAGVEDVDVDTVAPSISVALDRLAAPSGWFNEKTGAPVAKYSCSDATSGVVACPENHTFGNGENQSHSGTVFDNAGNSTSAGVSNVDVDLIDPTITWTGGPADGASYYFGSVPSVPTCNPADTLSGSDDCAIADYGTTVGSHIMTATAHDVAGNEYSEQRSYTVLAWTLKGFYHPVDMSGILNVVKGGSTVPLKFEVFAGATELTDTTIVSSWVKQVTCPAPGEDTVEVLATGGTSLRYDWTAGQFIYNWQTPKLPGKCYSVTMTTQDGSALTALFKLK